MTDEEILEALHMRDAERMTAEQIAHKMGVTKNKIVGLLWRIDNESKKRGSHMDGTMKPRWWVR